MLSAKQFLNTPPSDVTANMEEDFFTSIMGRNGTYKTTYRHRFSEINGDFLRQIQPTDHNNIELLDVGISSGINTIELYNDFKNDNININIVATDILIDACLIRVFPGCYALTDNSSFPLRFDTPWGTLTPWVTTRDIRNGFFIVRKLTNALFMHRIRQLNHRGDTTHMRAVKLVTPRLLGNKDIVINNDDITQYNALYTNRFNVIRAANILNKSYFSPETLRAIIKNLVYYLKRNDSFLFVVRTHNDRTNHGTLFRIDGNRRLSVVWRTGDGSEIEDIALDYVNT